MNHRTLFGLIACLTVFVASAAPAQELKSPDQVKVGLRLMMQVVNDFDRQINRKTFQRLPHENQEFKEACGALQQAVANEPEAFKRKVSAGVKQSLDIAQSVADESGSADETKLRSGHGRLLKAVNAVFALFPEALRPDPTVQPGGRAPPVG